MQDKKPDITGALHSLEWFELWEARIEKAIKQLDSRDFITLAEHLETKHNIAKAYAMVILRTFENDCQIENIKVNKVKTVISDNMMQRILESKGYIVVSPKDTNIMMVDYNHTVKSKAHITKVDKAINPKTQPLDASPYVVTTSYMMDSSGNVIKMIVKGADITTQTYIFIREFTLSSYVITDVVKCDAKVRFASDTKEIKELRDAIDCI